MKVLNSLLPPASEGWRKVIFSVCLSVHISTGRGGGYPVLPNEGEGEYPHPRSVQGGIPSKAWTRGVPHPRSRLESTPSRVQTGEYLIPGPDSEVPHPRSRQGRGYPWVPPIQVRMGGYPGVTPPIQDWMGYTLPLSGGTRRAVWLLRSRKKTFLFY